MIYILRSDDRISGDTNNFTLQLSNNHLINKNKKYIVYLKSILPIMNVDGTFIELNIKGLGSSYVYDTKSQNIENNILKYLSHTDNENTLYYPKYILNSLDLSTIEIQVFDIFNNELADVNKLIIVLELQELQELD